MIIGIDIHGVLDTYTLQFKALIHRIKKSHNIIYIITGPEENKASKELTRLGLLPVLDYDKIISVVDWLKAHLKKDEIWQDKNGNWWCDDVNWWCSKARICREYNVDIMIDDSEKYLIGWDAIDCRTAFHLVKDGIIKRVR